jgi:glycosyltransferase involved in cell wall biosynthesis
MRILLSAYACEPGKGSEPGVGWNWAIETARLGHDVWVITRANNRSTIEASPEAAALPTLHFAYVDLPPAIRWFKQGNRGVQLYYLLWQVAAYRLAHRLIQQHAFDYVHHITFVTVRQPSFMGLLGLPFILGPIGGGESTPSRLRRGFRLKDRAFEFLRAIANASVLVNPLQHLTFATADKIFVTSEQTLALIPGMFRAKAKVQLAIGVEPIPDPAAGLDRAAAADRPAPCHVAPGACESNASSAATHAGNSQPALSGLRLLYAGNLLHWKGVHLALMALAEARQTVPSATLTIVGHGAAEPWLRSLAASLGLADAIVWLGKQPRATLLQLYSQYDIFLYPSLHDSGAMVVLEALRSSLPVIALDLGGPGVVVDRTCGRLIVAQRQSQPEVVHALASAIVELASSTSRLPLRDGARRRAAHFTWQSLVLVLVDAVLADLPSVAHAEIRTDSLRRKLDKLS